MLKKILFLLAFLFFAFVQNNVYAQQNEGQTAPTIVGSSIVLSPEPLDINGNTPFVEITFEGLKPNSKWHICSRNDGCGKAKDNKNADGSGNLTMTVCAANDNRLKRDGDCDKENDYFHEGKVYSITLYEDEDQERRGPQVRFFVNHFYPDVTASTSNGLLEVVIEGDRRPGPSKKRDRNNYQIVVEGEDNYGNKYKHDACITIENDNGSARALFGLDGADDSTPISQGKYLIKVNERVNEGGIRSKLDPCNGGFTYWHIFTSINAAGEMVPLQVVCSPTSGGIPNECRKDPNASDIEGFNKLIAELGIVGKLTLLCDKIRQNDRGEYECLEIDTAIGSIPTNPIAFIERLFSIVLTLAGIAALGLLIYGGYNYMVSRGDPERIKGARETITSAIVGLLFIIFSLVILQVIAGDILRIPGFGGSQLPEVEGGTTGEPFVGDPVVQP